MYTSSVANAYFLPLRGVEGAGEGGRSCPSRSTFENALPRELIPVEVGADIVSGCRSTVDYWVLAKTMHL